MSDTEQPASPKQESQPEFVEDRTSDVIDLPKADDAAPEAEEVSKRLFVRPISHETTMEEVEKLFTALGSVTDISLKPGYGFIEYENLSDADKAIETFNGNTSLGYQIMVERAMVRGSRRKEAGDRPARPIALHRLLVSGYSDDFSWQDLKDLSRDHGVEAVFTKVDQGNVGVIDVASDEDRDSLKTLTEWKGVNVAVSEDPRGPAPPPRSGRGGRGGRGGSRFGGRGGPRFGGYRGDRGGDRFGDRRDGDRYGGDRYGGDRRGSDRFGDRRSYGDRRGGDSRGGDSRGGDRSDRRSRPREEPSW